MRRIPLSLATYDEPSDPRLPAHYELTRSQLVFSGLSIAAALLVLGAFGFRVATRLDLWQWWVPLAFVGGIAAADFGSGLVHWGADTWGRDDLPVIGHRLLVPFRVHHINPDDFLRRSFIDTNGDVAFLAVPVLLGLLAVPLETAWGGPVAVFGFAFCGIGMMTNQIHQWAHMPSPPRPICVLRFAAWFWGAPSMRRIMTGRMTPSTASPPDGATGRSRRSGSFGVSRPFLGVNSIVGAKEPVERSRPARGDLLAEGYRGSYGHGG